MNDTIGIEISDDVGDLYGAVKLAYRFFADLQVIPTPPRLKKIARLREQGLRDRVESLEVHTNVAAWRTLADAMGLVREDETPAPIGLAHSILVGRSLPKINSVVDCANVAAITHLTPVGVFDLARLTPPIQLRLATEGETIHPIGALAPVRCRRGEIVYADSMGIFSRYSRDADRSKVTFETATVLCVVDGTPSTPFELVEEAVADVEDLIIGISGPEARVVSRGAVAAQPTAS